MPRRKRRLRAAGRCRRRRSKASNASSPWQAERAVSENPRWLQTWRSRCGRRARRWAGAIIVTTTQEVALIDARKAATMFQKVNVPVLGLIENMSYFLCPSDGKRYDIFGDGGGAREAARLKVPLLGQIPIDIATRESGDRGLPITAAAPESSVATAFLGIA